jgi:cobyrinic acid a,c-diamide synthase
MSPDALAVPPATPGLLVAAPKSGSGKTILTLGLMRAFARHGVRVAGLKNGPDYIDPAFHAAATGRQSLNLDTWAMPQGLIGALAARAAADSDLIIAEGSMGLFDGVAAPPGCTGASADLAAALHIPVLLILDVSGQSQTAAAIVKGCATLDPEVRLAGVILNKVASERHRRLAADAIAAAGFEVLGALPRSDTLVLPERHLGLVQAGETPRLDAMLDAIADFVADHVDLDRVRAAARPVVASHASTAGAIQPPGQRIAVARDGAFSFFYPHLAQGWHAAGAELRFFSPLADEAPPADCDVCWLPGGYPELHAGRIGQAERFRGALRSFAETKPVHGECGGYMVLGQTLVDAEGATHRMTGLIGASFSFAKRKMNLGYRDVVLSADCCLGAAGSRLRGHEFHYATMLDADVPDPPLVLARDAHGAPPKGAGSRRGHTTGSFFHLVAGVNPSAP